MNDTLTFSHSCATQLIPVINILFPGGSKGAEIGVRRAVSSCEILQQCPAVEEIILVDPWLPWEDNLQGYEQISASAVDLDRRMAHYHLEWSGADRTRYQILEMTSDQAAAVVKDGSLDWVFLDAHTNRSTTRRDLKLWSPKVRQGGLMAMHDWRSGMVRDEIELWWRDTGQGGIKSCVGDTAMWIK